MNRICIFFLCISILFASCSSSTVIKSIPTGANLYLDGERVGKTPYSHSDTKVSFSATTVRLEKEGYETYNSTFKKDEEVNIGAIIGGIFFWIPFLWTMDYKPVRTYELNPTGNIDSAPKDNQSISSKSHKLRELKQLLDDQIITKEEFEIEKKKILDN